MIKIDVKGDGAAKIEGDIATVSIEINHLIRFLNQYLDNRPDFTRNAAEQLLVYKDEDYKEICKFSVRMNEARKRVEEIKKKRPDIFDDNIPMEKKTELMKEDIFKMLDEFKKHLDEI